MRAIGKDIYPYKEWDAPAFIPLTKKQRMDKRMFILAKKLRDVEWVETQQRMSEKHWDFVYCTYITEILFTPGGIHREIRGPQVIW